MLLEFHEFPARGNHGEKPDVVLIHGTGADASLWQPQIELLTGLGHRCIVPELRGHGRTHEPGEPTGLDVHVQDMLETLEVSKVKFPAMFVGHSLGAIISMILAQRRPEMISQILAVSMPGRVPKPVSTIFRFLVTWPFETIRGTLLHHSLPKRERILISTEVHSLREIVENFAAVNFVDRPPLVACPVHFSVGRLDVVAPWVHVRSMHRQIPNSTFRVFDWSGHCCMDDEPDKFNDWFMEKIAAGSSAQLS